MNKTQFPLLPKENGFFKSRKISIRNIIGKTPTISNSTDESCHLNPESRKEAAQKIVDTIIRYEKVTADRWGKSLFAVLAGLSSIKNLCMAMGYKLPSWTNSYFANLYATSAMTGWLHGKHIAKDLSGNFQKQAQQDILNIVQQYNIQPSVWKDIIKADRSEDIEAGTSEDSDMVAIMQEVKQSLDKNALYHRANLLAVFAVEALFMPMVLFATNKIYHDVQEVAKPYVNDIVDIMPEKMDTFLSLVLPAIMTEIVKSGLDKVAHYTGRRICGNTTNSISEQCNADLCPVLGSIISRVFVASGRAGEKILEKFSKPWWLSIVPAHFSFPLGQLAGLLSTTFSTKDTGNSIAQEDIARNQSYHPPLVVDKWGQEISPFAEDADNDSVNMIGVAQGEGPSRLTSRISSLPSSLTSRESVSSEGAHYETCSSGGSFYSLQEEEKFLE